MSDAATQWHEWLDQVCAAVGVDPGAVPVGEVLGLAGSVSRDVVRPMAPVSAFVWGLAVAAHPDADPARLRRAILDCAAAHRPLGETTPPPVPRP